MGKYFPNTATLFMERLEPLLQQLDDFDSSILCDLSNPATIPSHLLPWLAMNVSVDVWDATWDEQTKRNVIASSIATHQKKGTVEALRNILDALDIGAVMEQWYEYDGEPYRFRIHLTHQKPLNKEDYDTIFMTIFEAKNLRSWLDKIIAYFDVQGIIYAGGVPTMHHHMKIYPSAIKNKQVMGNFNTGGASLYQDKITIQPPKINGYSIIVTPTQGSGTLYQEKITINHATAQNKTIVVAATAGGVTIIKEQINVYH